MSQLTTRLSMNELTGRILDMAQTGVYRESLFEAFRPVATKREIKAAIALAKQFGLQTDPALRDEELGTYYQAEQSRVSSFHSTVRDSLVLTPGDNIAEQIFQATRTIRLMLIISSGGAIALLLFGGSALLTGHSDMALLWWCSALCCCGVWLGQKTMAKPFL